MPTEAKRISKRTPKPNLRYIDDHHVVMDEVLDELGNIKAKAVVVTETVEAAVELPSKKSFPSKQSSKPSNENAHSKKPLKPSSAIVASTQSSKQSNETEIKSKNSLKPSNGIVPSKQSSKPSTLQLQRGRVCTRQELRPKLLGTIYEIDCQEMAESALEKNNMNMADLEKFLRENMKVQKGNKVTTKQGQWKIMVACKKVSFGKHGFNKMYLKYLIKKFLWKRGLRDWVHVDASLPTTLKVLYYRTAETIE